MSKDLPPQSDTLSEAIPYWKKIVVVLSLGWIAIWIYRTVLTPIYPEIQASLGGASDAEIGLIASLYFLAYTCAQIPAGIMVDRVGQRKVLIPGFSCFLIGAFLVGNADGLTMIYIGSLFAGLGCGSFFSSAYSLSSEHVPLQYRGIATAIINSGAAFGMAFGLIGSSYLVKNVGVEWHYLLFFIVALLAVIIGLYALILKNKEPAPKQEQQQAETPTNQRSVLFSPVMVSAYIMYFATNYGYYMIVTWLPSYLQLERGFEGFAIGFASALVAIAAIPGALYFSRMSDKYRDKKVKFIISLELAAAVTLVLTVLAPNTTILMVSLMLYGLLGKLAVEPIIISFVADNVSKNGYGTTFSLFNFFGMSSAVITPYLTGFISDMTGSKVMSFYLSAFFIIVGTCVFFAINRKRTPELKTA